MPESAYLVSKAKSAINKLLIWRHHRNFNIQVQLKLDKLQQETGKIKKADKKRCDEYATEVLGWQGHAKELYLFTLRSGRFKEGWITDNYNFEHLIPRFQGSYGKVANSRCLTTKLFSDKSIIDLGYCVNGNWFLTDEIPVSEESLKSELRNKYEKVVYKLDDSFQGKGVHVVETSKIDLSFLSNLGNGILQKYVRQHPVFSQFNPSSVACIRLTSIIAKSRIPEVRSSFIRFGKGMETHVKSNMQIAVPTTIDKGEFSDKGYDIYWRSMYEHPKHNEPFVNKTIPNYTSLKKTVLALHSQMPMVDLIGWDFTIDDKNNPILMEWNGYGAGVGFLEATQGPCFKDMDWDKTHKNKKSV